ncbi:MAG: hypothetical protein ACFFAN_08525 [Promethearchaeota archaeon]
MSRSSNEVKIAKKVVKSLKKKAKLSIKQGNHEIAGELYNSATIIASDWDLVKEWKRLEDSVITTIMGGLKAELKYLEDDAKQLARKEEFSEASLKYDEALQLATMIFKLGEDGILKEVKKLSNKVKEYEKIS